MPASTISTEFRHIRAAQKPQQSVLVLRHRQLMVAWRSHLHLAVSGPGTTHTHTLCVVLC